MIKLDNIIFKTIIDNTAASPFVMAEWGLSIYINADGKKILFDTGAGNQHILLHNMNHLGIKASEIDYLVLSHGHQDHTGGLRDFFKKMHQEKHKKTMKIICHSKAMDPEYIKGIGSFGCPFTKEELVSLGAQFNFIKKPIYLDENKNIVVSGEIPMTNNYESVGKAFYRKVDTNSINYDKVITDEATLCFKPNDQKFKLDEKLIDDQAIFLKTNKGLIIVLGCAHRGMINTIRYAQKITNMDQVYMVIGGTHTAGASNFRMNSTIRDIKKINISKIGVSHCTGLVSGCKLANELGKDIFFHNNAGSIIEFSNNKLKINEF